MRVRVRVKVSPRSRTRPLMLAPSAHTGGLPVATLSAAICMCIGSCIGGATLAWFASASELTKTSM